MSDLPIHRTEPDGHPPSDETTLTDVVEGYRANGFGGDFFAEPGGTVRCGTCGSVLQAAQLEMQSLRRLEGASDPADMQAVVATSYRVCGADGTLVVGFGPAASATDADVFAVLADHRDSPTLPPDSAPGADDATDAASTSESAGAASAGDASAGEGRSSTMEAADVANGEHL